MSNVDEQIHAGGRRFRRSKRSGGAETGGEPVMALQAELALLREENARLQSAQYQPADMGGVLGLLRSLPSEVETSAEETTDAAAALLVEGLVMRDSLLEVCMELGEAVAAVARRLRALDIDLRECDSDVRRAA